MCVLIIFIALVLYIFSVSIFVSKTENKTNRKYNVRKKYNRHSYQKHNLNRKKHKGDL